MSRLSRIFRVRLKKVKLKKLRSIKWIAGIIFVEFGWFVTGLAPSTEIAWVTGILLFTIYLFIFEIVNVDETAITIMVLLGHSARAESGKPMSERLARELYDAARGEGKAMQTREQTHRMADANKAFAHFAW